MRIYPVGYSTPGAAAFINRLLQEPRGMLLIDIRYKPYSSMEQWQQKSLMSKYPGRYRWGGRYLGNVNYKGGPIKIAHLANGIRGLQMYLTEGYHLILLCGCREYETCHRKVVVDELLKIMPSVEVVLFREEVIR